MSFVRGRWTLALLPCAIVLGACTTILQERPDESVEPPPDHRPLPETSDPLETNAPTVLAEGLNEPRGMLHVGEELIVAEAGAGRLLAVHTTDGTVRVVASELGEPWDVAGDDTAYVVSDASGGRVLRLSEVDAPVVLAEAQVFPRDVVVHAGYAYWLAAGEGSGGGWSGGALRRTAVAGGGIVEDLAGELFKPSGLVVSSEHVYFAVATSPSKLQRVALTGGVAEEIGTAPEEAYDLARDEASGQIFWATRNSNWPYSGWINEASSTGGTTTRLVATQAKVSHVALDGSYVYWAFVDGVHRYRRDKTGAVEPVVLAVAIGDLILGDASVFLSDRLSGRIYRRAKSF
jgi:hypothetical protein